MVSLGQEELQAPWPGRSRWCHWWGTGSLAEGCQPADAVPEGGWLSLGLCQRQDLLLRQAGGEGRVLLACQVVGSAEGWQGKSQGQRCLRHEAIQGRACRGGMGHPQTASDIPLCFPWGCPHPRAWAALRGLQGGNQRGLEGVGYGAALMVISVGMDCQLLGEAGCQEAILPGKEHWL